MSASTPVLFSSPRLPFAPVAGAETVDESTNDAACYALVQTAPAVPSAECEVDRPSVEIAVRWGASVLALVHLTPPRTWFIGEAAEGEHVDCTLPREAIGTSRAPVVVADDNGFVSLVALPGAIGRIQLPGQPAMSLAEALEAELGKPCAELPGAQQIALPSGATARLELGGVVVEVAAQKAGKAVAGRIDLDRRALPFTGLSALVHIGLLAAVGLFVPSLASAESADATSEQNYILQQYLAASAERDVAQEQPQTVDTTPGDRMGGTGTRSKGSEGSMGDTLSTKRGGRYGVAGTPDNTDPHISRGGMLEDAGTFGAIGIINAMNAGSRAPTAVWGRDEAFGNDPLSARGNMWGDTIDDASGAGGLGLSGIGEGAAGLGEGIGLGTIGTIGNGAGLGDGQGFGPGHGRSRFAGTGGHRPTAPTMRVGTTSVSGKIPPEVIQRIVRQNFGRFRGCYESALRSQPNLAGRVSVRFVIGRDGSVSSAANGGSDLPDSGVVSCVVRSFYGLSFPQPDGGIVTVTYPILFTAGQ